MKPFLLISLLFLSGPAFADVRCVQSFLAETAFDPGPVDGAWGRNTEQAAVDLFRQLEISLEFEIHRENSDLLCGFFQSDEGQEIKELAALKDYGLYLTPEQLSEFSNERIFDFSMIEVARDTNVTCAFLFERQVREDPNRIELMAMGRVVITNGILEFGDHTWRTGGLADQSYLQNEAAVAIDVEGVVNGVLPYFHLFIDAGEVALPPQIVQLPREYFPEGNFPEGITTFDVDDWQIGRLILRRCS